MSCVPKKPDVWAVNISTSFIIPHFFGAGGETRTLTPFGHSILNRARLPIPPLRQIM